MSLDTWQLKSDLDLSRRGCMVCGAHVLTHASAPALCACCGGEDLRSVAAADAQLRRARDLRDHVHQMTDRLADPSPQPRAHRTGTA